MSSTLRQWDGCGIEEKVERLRSELLGQRWLVNAARHDAARLQNHEHNVKGEIVVPLRYTRDHGVEALSRDRLA